MNWPAVGLWLFDHIKVFFAGIGLTGGGVGFIKLMKHWPPPRKAQKKLGAVFDTIQDILSNAERIGQRADSDSTFVSIKTESGKQAESSSTVTTGSVEAPLDAKQL